MTPIIINVIVLQDRVFDRYVVFYQDGINRVNCKTFEEAQTFINHFPNKLREVPLNSKMGQRILARIGSERSRL